MMEQAVIIVECVAIFIAALAVMLVAIAYAAAVSFDINSRKEVQDDGEQELPLQLPDEQ